MVTREDIRDVFLDILDRIPAVCFPRSIRGVYLGDTNVVPGPHEGTTAGARTIARLRPR